MEKYVEKYFLNVFDYTYADVKYKFLNDLFISGVDDFLEITENLMVTVDNKKGVYIIDADEHLEEIVYVRDLLNNLWAQFSEKFGGTESSNDDVEKFKKYREELYNKITMDSIEDYNIEDVDSVPYALAILNVIELKFIRWCLEKNASFFPEEKLITIQNVNEKDINLNELQTLERIGIDVQRDYITTFVTFVEVCEEDLDDILFKDDDLYVKKGDIWYVIKNLLYIFDLDYDEEVKSFNEHTYNCKFPNFKDMNIREKTPHGWLRGFLVPYEKIAGNSRYVYWNYVMHTEQFKREDIPQKAFLDFDDSNYIKTHQMLKDCIEKAPIICSINVKFELFIDWLLYALGDYRVQKLPLKINGKLNEYWYDHFVYKLLLLYPSEYFGDLIKLYIKDMPDKCITPIEEAEKIVNEYFGSDNKEANKFKKFHDDCAGTGSKILLASNYTLNLEAECDNDLLQKILAINCYFYVPWAIFMTNEISKGINDLHKKYWIK